MDLPLRHEVERILSTRGLKDPARHLNDLLATFLEAEGFVRDDGLLRALRAIRRDRFLEGVDLRTAYSDRAVLTAGEEGTWVGSSCSTPSVTASMIQALGLEGGERILEIGTGTGYSAALLATCAPSTRVLSLECLEGEARNARGRLTRLGLTGVEVRHETGAIDPARLGAFDRVLVTCGLRRLPTGWLDLVADGGRIVVPLGSTVFVLDRRGQDLEGTALLSADFVGYRTSGETHDDGWRLQGSMDGPAAQGRAVRWPRRPAGRRDLDPDLAGSPAARTKGPILESARLQSFMLLLEECEPDRFFQFVEADGTWGFGLNDLQGGGSVICRSGLGFTFRHYRRRWEQPAFEVRGDHAPTESFFEQVERWVESGAPLLERLQVRARRLEIASDSAEEPDRAWDWRLEVEAEPATATPRS